MVRSHKFQLLTPSTKRQAERDRLRRSYGDSERLPGEPWGSGLMASLRMKSSCLFGSLFGWLVCLVGRFALFIWLVVWLVGLLFCCVLFGFAWLFALLIQHSHHMSS